MAKENQLTLAIAKVGHLLLEGKISNVIDGEIGDGDVNLTIPLYQRPYKWTARNAIQLLDDITDAMYANKEVYRVGTLILHKEKGKDTYNIVDGLQRTITFCLLLKALGKEPKNFLQQKMYANSFNTRNIANNYKALVRRVQRHAVGNLEQARADAEKERLTEFVTDHCELIVVITDNLSEAFQFFDSQNARGKALYPHDLLKAYHLREMNGVAEDEVEKIVAAWEGRDQAKLAELFGEYLYRIKEWIAGNMAGTLNHNNMQMFKGITRYERTPYAQFYKGAYSYAAMVNASAMPFVSGTRDVNAFQINAPIIAGKPFFDYATHYSSILYDIQNNDKYYGFYINGNEIVMTLDKYFCGGVGNRIARLLFDSAALLYVDKFCPESFPTKDELDLFEQFVVYAFIWAYSLRAQYENLGWKSAQNYVMGWAPDDRNVNSFNIYKLISVHSSPTSLLSELADKVTPIGKGQIKNFPENIDAMGEGEIYNHYLHFFGAYGFIQK